MMQKNSERIQFRALGNYFDRVAQRLSSYRTVKAINRGLMYLVPLIMIGSFVLAVLNLPVDAFQDFLLNVFGLGWRETSLMIHNATLNVMGLAALFTVSYALANEFEVVQKGEVNPITLVLTTFSSYVIIIKQTSDIISFPQSGANGLFYSLFISIVATNGFFFFDSLQKKLRRNKTSVFDSNLLLKPALRAIFPAFLTIFCFALARSFLDYTQWDTIVGAAFKNFLETYFVNDSFFSVVSIVFFTQISWFFGIHGGNVIMDSIQPMATAPVGAMINKEFYNFIYLGGSGATLGLLLALFIHSINHKENRLAKVSLFPAVFNINETLMYGLPLIFNPYYLVPFLAAPLVLGGISYFSVATGLVPGISQEVMWTTPIFMSGYLNTKSIAGAVLQLVNLLVSAAIYYPFVGLSQRNERRNRLETFQQLKAEIPDIISSEYVGLLHRSDKIGEMARDLVSEMEESFRYGKVPFHLEYQPKVDADGRIWGGEALLRWIHPEYGYISPVLIITLSDEGGLSSKLGTWIYNQALDEYARWCELGYSDLYISINLDPIQLRSDPDFVKMIGDGLVRTGVNPKHVELELTEHVAIHTNEVTKEKLRGIRKLGLNLSIDDLGTGYSSLMYLSDFEIETIKIDSGMVRGIETDKNRQGIVLSILSLAEQLRLNVVVEGVETKEQLDKLVEYGCKSFQGFYFSRSLKSDAYLAYVKEHGIAKMKMIGTDE